LEVDLKNRKRGTEIEHSNPVDPADLDLASCSYSSLKSINECSESEGEVKEFKELTSV
jgi:hypothetical protein